MKLKITYSLEKEIDNYINSLYSFRWHKHGRNDIQEKLLSPFPEDFKKNLKNAKSEKEARAVVREFRSQNLQKTRESYKKIATVLEKAWEREGEKIINKLEKVYGKKFPFSSLTIYLSSIPICPYNYKEKWIMMFANTSSENQLRIILHELNHFMFYYYFANLRRELGEEKFESLKEALTVLTNPEEKGYPSQKELRKWLKSQKGTISEILERKEWKKLLK